MNPKGHRNSFQVEGERLKWVKWNLFDISLTPITYNLKPIYNVSFIIYLE